MANAVEKWLGSIRGTARLRSSQPHSETPVEGITPSNDSSPTTQPSWISDAQKLVPGEALAGYIALQPIALAAQQPGTAKVVLALVFLVVAVTLKWFASQDSDAAQPGKTAQPGVVAISALSYLCLVYATGGQIFWHAPVADQALYGQIGTAALGALGPSLLRRLQPSR